MANLSPQLSCPQCHVPCASQAAVQEWMVCESCQHRWAVAEAITDAIAGETQNESALAVGAEDPTSVASQANDTSAAGSGIARIESHEYLPVEARETDSSKVSLHKRKSGIEAEGVAEGGKQKESTRAPYDSQAAMPGADRTEFKLTVVCSSCGHSFKSSKSDNEQETCPVCKCDFFISTFSQPPQTVGDPLIGKTLRGCVIDKKIGEGGMGTVYHAHQVSLDRSVAIKVLPSDLTRNRNFITRFEREAKNLARINHPNILHIYDFGEDASLGIYFMIIEFVSGNDLGHILHYDRLLSPLKVLDVIRQAALGLEMAWQKGVIHRDIKPDNLMLTADGIWKVMDFGLAKANDGGRDVTSVGVRVGTPAFMSPEQCDGVDVDFRADIYSLGCTAFLALTGRLPFDGETPFAIMLKHKSETVPWVRTFCPNVHEDVDRLVFRMLAKRPDDRFANLRELIDLVEELETRLAGTSSVLRKTRGPFRALKQPPEVDLKIQEEGSRSSKKPTAVITGAADAQGVPDYLKPVDPPRSRSSSETKAYTPRISAETRAPTDHDLLRVKLNRVRSRTHREELDNTVAEALKSEESGYFVAAAVAWKRASMLTADIAEMAEYKQRSRAARRRSVIKSTIRITTAIISILLIIIIGLWVGTPLIHNFYANRQIDDALDMEVRDRSVCMRALERAIETQGQPYTWYEPLFHHSYRVSATDRAQDALERLKKESVPVVPLPIVDDPSAHASEVDIAPLEKLMNDDGSSWIDVAQRAQAALEKSSGEQRARIMVIFNHARRELFLIDKDLALIKAAWVAGRHADVIALAQSFNGKHPRSGLIMPHFQLGKVEVVDADSGALIVNAHATIQTLDEASDLGFPATPIALGIDGIFARPVDIGVTVMVSAATYQDVRVTIPARAPAGPMPLTFRLHPGIAWTGSGSSASLPATISSIDSQTVLVQCADAMSVINAADGIEIARLERRTVPIASTSKSGNDQWESWAQWHEDKLIVGSTDGVVMRLALPSLTGVQELYRYGNPIIAWYDKEIAVKAGMRVQVFVDMVNTVMTLHAVSRNNELWSRPITHGHMKPSILPLDDRVVMMNDHSVVIHDELEGQEIARADFTGTRTSDPVLFDHADAVVATTAGLNMLRLDVEKGKSITVQEYFDGEAQGCQAVANNKHLLVARQDKSLHLLRHTGEKFDAVWPHPVSVPLDAGKVQRLALTADYAVVVDDTTGIYLYARQDGRLLRYMVHGTSIQSAPLQCGPGLLVADTVGHVTMYHLPHIR